MSNTVFKIFILLFGLTTSCYSQDFSSLWQGHYSYNDIVDVVSGDQKIYAAAQNAVFRYDTSTNELTTITSVEGLSGEQITTIYYSSLYQYLLIGYETGLIEVYSETENSVLSVVDILEKVNITPVNKRINHFFEHEGQIYISTDYGVSIYDLDRLEFGDTYFLGNGGAQVSVKQVSILNNDIYVACLNGNGIKKADLSNPNLIDYQQWQTVIIGNYHTMQAINNKLYTVRDNKVLYEINGTAINTLFTLPQLPLDADMSATHLVYATQNAIYVYDENIQLVNTFQPTEDYDTNFTSAISLDNNIYIGTDAFGVLSNSISVVGDYIEIKPNGPLFNETFRLNAESGVVWSSFGDYTEDLVPEPLRKRGLSYYRNEAWESIPYDSLFGARNLAQISINPFIQNQVFVSSFHDGLIELNNFEPTVLYEEDNSGLESLVLEGSPNYKSIRVSATQFDSNGLLWSMNSLVFEPLKSYDPISGSWKSYDFSSIIQDAIRDEFGYFDLAIDNNGTKWIGAYTNGIYAYNESISDTPLRNIRTEEQGLPFPRVNAVAVDNRNQLWVGTFTGLRVLYNTSGFYEDSNPTLSSIIILEEGIAKELLEGETITDIKVDGSNNKWIGTVDSGVFYLSPDGQTTIYHFTKDNSPLPSNRINDISVDGNNGIVYIATIKGLLAFKAGGSKTASSLEDAFVYPNPVRPEYDILGFNDLNDINKGVKISGLTERVNIKITDIEGNLVAEAQSNVNLRSSNTSYNFAIDGGTAVWNGKNLGNNVVRTGVYLILISDLDSFETKVLKVLIVR
ncbi:type IX secretion system anionic LPS delivery protein PorZ [Winogradskyella sediminis]|uniref:type IX secretion system anionic LPS delivery protein PorZ n=1 Tax=Winogradskyella sediminis TaxID=1382466 RepID=UPI000E21ECAE|nr:two-component regulator propeller domain-containing protein [Winogradskyella sediminis]REG89137.1 two component regulator with propeller domain [Winogradskyella sediminis]